MKREVMIFSVASFLFGLVLGMVIMSSHQKDLKMAVEQGMRNGSVQQQNPNANKDQQNLPPGHPDINIDYDKEIQEREDIIKANPNDLRAMVELANLYIQVRRNKEALTWFERVIEKDNKNIDSLSGAATIYLSLGETDRAEEYYKRVLEIEEYNPGALLGLGWIKLHKEDDAKGAIKLWELLIEHNPNYPLNQELKQEIDRLKKEKNLL